MGLDVSISKHEPLKIHRFNLILQYQKFLQSNFRISYDQMWSIVMCFEAKSQNDNTKKRQNQTACTRNPNKAVKWKRKRYYVYSWATIWNDGMIMKKKKSVKLSATDCRAELCTFTWMQKRRKRRWRERSQRIRTTQDN